MESNIINIGDQEHQEDYEDNMSSLGIGRSYECVFCKRGFNTAQALGGHMNIHRKDRARSNNNIIKPSSTLVDDHPRFYHHQINHHHPSQRHHHHHRQLVNIQMGSSSAAGAGAEAAQPVFFPNGGHHHNYSLMNFNINMMPCGSTAVHDQVNVEKSRITQEDDLDLELRLGAP